MFPWRKKQGPRHQGKVTQRQGVDGNDASVIQRMPKTGWSCKESAVRWEQSWVSGGTIGWHFGLHFRPLEQKKNRFLLFDGSECVVEDDSPRKRTWSEHNCYGFPRLTKMSSLCICYAYMCIYTCRYMCYYRWLLFWKVSLWTGASQWRLHSVIWKCRELVWTLNDWKIVSTFSRKRSHQSHSEKQSRLLCDVYLSHQTFYVGKKDP